MKCLRCDSEMENGVIVVTGFQNRPVGQTWGKSLKQPPFVGTQILPELEGPRAVETSRCTQCGYLESYAK